MFKPTGRSVVVKQLPFESKSGGGIITATKDEADRQQAGEDTGVLVDIGPLAWEYEVYEDGKPKLVKLIPAEIGDVVVFNKYAGKQYTHSEIMDGRRKSGEVFYHIMDCEDIRGVLPKDMVDSYKQKRGNEE